METETQAIPVQPELEISQVARTPHWSAASRIAFRFFLVYFGLYCLTTQLVTSLVPLPSVEVPDPSTFWPVRPVVLWTAAHVFHLAKPPSYADTGSGDKAFDFVLAFCLFVFATVATVVWSALDRKRESYPAMHKWFRLAIRFFLAGQMMAYGLSKAVPIQMPFPFLFQLVSHFGNFSPMGILWSSIGASPAYEIFAGCAELLGGILLIFPRTTTLGALVCLADMTQVFMLNMTYDVPVKLLSFHLILLSLFLLAPEFRRLLNFFFLNRPVKPSTQVPLFAGRRAGRIAFAAQLVFGVWLLGMNAYGSWVNWSLYGGGRPKSPLYGIWEVDEQRIDGQIRSPLLNDYGRWHRVIFDFPTFVTFQRIDDSFAGHRVTIDLKAKTLALTDVRDKNWKADFTFERQAADRLILDGTMDGHKTRLELKLVPNNKFLLVNRGFHWIQEFPFNR